MVGMSCQLVRSNKLVGMSCQLVRSNKLVGMTGPGRPHGNKHAAKPPFLSIRTRRPRVPTFFRPGHAGPRVPALPRPSQILRDSNEHDTKQHDQSVRVWQGGDRGEFLPSAERGIGLEIAPGVGAQHADPRATPRGEVLAGFPGVLAAAASAADLRAALGRQIPRGLRVPPRAGHLLVGFQEIMVSAGRRAPGIPSSEGRV